MSEKDTPNVISLEEEADLVNFSFKKEKKALIRTLLYIFLTQPKIVEGTTGLCGAILSNKCCLESLPFLKLGDLRTSSIEAY